MTPELWQRVERVYHEALNREPGQRAAFLAQACAGDEILRQEVDSLLERDPSAPEILFNRSVPAGGRLAAGERLGPYEITGPLGAGGMGEVFLARDTRLGREVAIKVLPAALVSDAGRRARLVREAQAASRLNHPNIVTVYDIGEEDGRTFLAMEYVPGKTLDAVIPSGGLPLDALLNYAVPMADALAKAHAAGLIHRDLKPGNIMVTPEGAVKLLDFGLAKWIEAPPKQPGDASLPDTESMAVMGTPAFMAPEQAEGRKADARSDIFCFGAVLYQMAAGRRAFTGNSTMATMAAVMHSDPEPLPKETPPELVRSILRCLRKDPERRWQSMADVRVTLEELREDAAAGNLAADVEKGSPRRWPALVAAGVLALAALVAGALWQRGRSPAAEVWTGTMLGGPIIASHPRISPDGQLLAFRAIVDGQSQVAVMKPDTASWTVLTHERNLNGVEYVAWARDGSKIYYDHEDIGVYSIAPLGGEPRLLLENAGEPEPLKDGSLIVVRPSLNGHRQLLHFWPDTGRVETLPASVLATDTRTIAAFPDGKEIAVLGFSTPEGGEHHLFVLDLATHRTHDLAAAADIVGPLGNMESQHPKVVAVSADGRAVLTLRVRDDSEQVVAIPRDGSKPERVLLTFPLGSTPLCIDASPDGSLYMDESGFQISALKIGPAGNVLSETALPGDAYGMMPTPDGFLFGLTRGGKSQLLVAKPGVDPRPLLNAAESVRLPGAWLGNGKLAFLMGEEPHVRLTIGSAEDGRVIQQFPEDAQGVTSIAASGDGRTLYYTRGGVIWAQAVAGGDPRKVGDGHSIAADPSGKTLYLLRSGSRGYELWRMPAAGGEAQRIDLPSGYWLTPNWLSPAAVNADGRLLLPVNTTSLFFFQVAIMDPARHTFALVPAPSQTVVSNAGWLADGSILARITRWSSTLWCYQAAEK